MASYRHPGALPSPTPGGLPDLLAAADEAAFRNDRLACIAAIDDIMDYFDEHPPAATLPAMRLVSRKYPHAWRR
jgi:hypothetical protein